MLTLAEALEAAEKFAVCAMDRTRIVETDWCWGFEPHDPTSLYGREMRKGCPAVVSKADGRVRLYARHLRAPQCVALAEKELQAREEAKVTGAYPTSC